MRVLSMALVLVVALAAGCQDWVGPGRPQSLERHIVICKEQNTLYLWERARLVRKYPVCTGREPGLTPEGRFEIVLRLEEPGGQLGARWLGLGVPGRPWGTTYGIHGTDEPDSIGHHRSAGCIRLHDDDVVELDRLVGVGTMVVVRS